MPAGAGRKSAPEWNDVIQMDSGKYACKHCNSEVSPKIERVKKHLQGCPKIVKSSEIVNIENDLISEETLSTSNTVSSTNVSRKRKIQKSMVAYVAQTSPREKEELDFTIARFFFSNNIPFNVASSMAYKEMIEKLRPGYAGPNRHNLAGPLLDQVANQIDKEFKENIETSSCVTLLLDGWSNTKNDPIIAISIYAGKTTFLLKAVDCEAHKKTAEYCADLAKEAIVLCKEKYEKEVIAMCTDNENKMIKMREILRKDIPGLITYGCAAHYVNLLEDIVTPKNIIKHIVEIHKYFRNHYEPHGWLREKGGRMPQLPNETRWNSQKECVSSFIENYHKYVEIVADHTDIISTNIAKLLDNTGLYRETLNLRSQLEDVGIILDKLQTDDTYIADAVEIWYNLYENKSLTAYKCEIKRRMDMALTPVHFLANMLHPTYQGQKLTLEQENIVEEWLIELHPDWLPFVLAFKIKDSEYYPSSMFSENVIKSFNARKWWQLIKMKTSTKGNLLPDFCSFIINISECPASSASLERIFSTYGFVWSSLRNQLGAVKAEKLVRIYKALQNKKL